LHRGDLGRDGHRAARGPLVFPVLLLTPDSSSPRNTWEYVQAQGNAREVPRRTIFLATVTSSMEGWGFL
jgi:hypothetical protein